uniref:Uncharacterized protein n=1 Tax=Arundo donax TaxID=35708 RepID=A0A0A9BID9_ARUDO
MTKPTTNKPYNQDLQLSICYPYI